MLNHMIEATIAYAARMPLRQRYYANDHARDTVVIEPHGMPLSDARAAPASLDAEGFQLVRHASRVTDFEDPAEVAAIYSGEIVELLLGLTGADAVFVTAPGILRFAESSGRAGSRNNSMPARFAHVDVSTETSAAFAARGLPEGKAMRRYAQFNLWRSIGGVPQDVPLAVADARSVAAEDLMIADAVFDEPGRPEWSFDSYLVAHNPAHRWCWYPDMTRDEVLVFRTGDSRDPRPVPHVAFDNPLAPLDCPPRVSIEMRAAAYWYA
ncbi:hypothetical protein H7F50_03185 [Novosphingobium flavum]|uniref:Methyltransferase n=1 Tax=Novosphingobium aerophilum TaxID=2839843 RepID=A0A7X1KBI3_9SPHN|nr:CmcJ/NvfI family oxidoreductase [Novosphingobium aerophilum]MBC2651185.1 hypothetical protein [Novosphingobium aerophilum]MBC2660742.1 hypothetical protein [Novosphingobium aerophilum]